MNINNNPNTSNNLNFKGIYAMQGTKSQVRRMAREIRNSEGITHFADKFVHSKVDKLTKKKVETHIILTNGDAVSTRTKKTPARKLLEPKERIVLKAQDFFNPHKISFLPESGRITVNNKIVQDDFIFSQSVCNFSEYEETFAIHVKKPTPLKKFIAKLNGLKKDEHHPSHDLYQDSIVRYTHVDIDDIEKANIGNINVVGIIGHGGSSDAYDTGENVLKVSYCPICPKKMTPKDLPYSQAGITPIPNTQNKIYHCIQPKTENDHTTNITWKDYKNFEKEIEELGYEDGGDLGPHQFGRYNGGLYLFDYASIRKKGELNRELIR